MITAQPAGVIENNSTALAVVTMLAGSTMRPRLAMRGASMSPLLREPMVLELGASRPDNRVGDILVFKRDNQLVAHRITSLRNGIVQTCGDARPWLPEYPGGDAIVGKVVAVFESDQPDARRVDSWLFRTRGHLKARLRTARAIPFHAKVLAIRFWRGIPWRRPRAYVALVSAMSAMVRRDAAAFERSLSLVEPSMLAAVARRHWCSAMLADELRALGHGPASSSLERMLQPVSRSIVLRSLVIKAQIAAVITSLSRAQIPFALLKGASRLHRNEPDALLQPISDLDILVPADRLENAQAALHADGYQERANLQRRERYRRLHHHAAQLHPPGPGRPVELHTALAPPRVLSLRLNWETLGDHLISSDGPAGRVWFLDDVGTALHLAVHSLGLRSLRDAVLLARLLLRMGAAELQELKSTAAQERTDPIRLEASLVFAADIAGVDWPRSKQVRDYIAWCMRREDVPLYFSTRSQFVEAWYAAGQRFPRSNWYLLDPKAGIGGSSANRPLRLLGRALTGACAYIYTLALRRPE